MPSPIPVHYTPGFYLHKGSWGTSLLYGFRSTLFVWKLFYWYVHFHCLHHFLANRPGLVESMATIPIFADHDVAISVDSDVIPAYNKTRARKLYLFSQAKGSKMQEDITSFVTSDLQQYQFRPVNENCEAIKNEINKTVEAHVPSRKSSKKQHQPQVEITL